MKNLEEEVVTSFNALTLPSSDVAFTAASVGGRGHRIAKDAAGLPAVLFAEGSSGTSSRIELKHLVVQYGFACEISEAGRASRESRVSVVRLLDAPPALIDVFLRVVAVFLSSSEVGSTGRSIDALLTMFRALTRPPRKTALGLWGELFVLVHAGDVDYLTQGWHQEPSALYDFVTPTVLLEVKTTVRSSRRHRFSLEQVAGFDSPINTKVVSIMTQASGLGHSVADLLELATSRCRDPIAAARLHTVAYSTLGDKWRQAATMRWDLQVGVSTVAVFDMADVPRPEVRDPAVSSVRFLADLNRVDPVAKGVEGLGTTIDV